MRVRDARLLLPQRRPDEPDPARDDDRQGRDLVHRPAMTRAPGGRPGASRGPAPCDGLRRRARPRPGAAPVRHVHARSHRDRVRCTCTARPISPASSNRTDLRFVPVTEVTTRSLADRRDHQPLQVRADQPDADDRGVGGRAAGRHLARGRPRAVETARARIRTNGPGLGGGNPSLLVPWRLVCDRNATSTSQVALRRLRETQFMTRRPCILHTSPGVPGREAVAGRSRSPRP